MYLYSILKLYTLIKQTLIKQPLYIDIYIYEDTPIRINLIGICLRCMEYISLKIYTLVIKVV